MVYETQRLLMNQSYQYWISSEFRSVSWFIIIGVLAIIYTIWIKLVNKAILRDLLLLGSLSSIGFILADLLLFNYYGLVEFTVRIFPWTPPVFIVSITISPIMIMSVYQYTSSWKSYILWVSICTAVLSFIFVPLYIFLGIFRFHGWTYYYQFLMVLTDAIIARALLLGVIYIEEHQSNSIRNRALMGLQPAASKPLPNSNNEDTTEDDMN